MDASHVVVRLQQSKGLQDAFRVHMLPESLTDAGLKLNDLCQITNEDGTILGYGIAWRAEDKMGSRPKVRPAKMTETFRDLYDFKDGSKVKISRTDMKLYPADKIVLYDVTPEGHNKPDAIDVTNWDRRIGCLFEDADALAPGVSFEVTGAKKYRRRFHIESIEAASAPEAACLYIMQASTEIALSGGTGTRPSTANGVSHALQGNGSARTTAQQNGSTHFEIDVHRIGGLLEQSQQLNKQMKRLVGNASSINRSPCSTILLHGYQGCGKTLILEALAESGFRKIRKVIRLERELLMSSTLSKGRAHIQEAFQQAAEATNQPSLILIDNLEAIGPAEDDKFASTLVKEITQLRKNSSRVMVVAATRSISNVNDTLVGPLGFWMHIEVPIPDVAARRQILNVLRGKPAFAKDDVSSFIAARTHGYTGADLELLHIYATEYATDRQEHALAERELARSPSLPTYNEANGLTETGPSDPIFEIETRDFAKALESVVPTALREIFTERPKVQWSDIGGSDEVRESFDEIIGLQQHDKDLFAYFRCKPDKGVLLYGPPGCSKTLTAQAVANSYNFNFIAIKGAELISKYVGDSEKSVREVFSKARAAAPCVIFFDEIDAIAGSRDLDGTKGLNVLTTLLNEMDGFEPLKDVFILAATNKPETLDPALLRPGRFDSHVYLGPPNLAARQDIFRIACDGVPLADEVKFAVLAGKTDGYSGAEIVRICEVAKKLSLRRLRSREPGPRYVTTNDFDCAKDEVKKGITKEMLDAYASFAG